MTIASLQSTTYRVLQVHNEYFSGRGGEDTVVSLEYAMLQKYGNEVEQLFVKTSDLRGASPFKILGAALSTPWSMSGYRQVKRAIERFRPDVIHFHNTFPLLSPSVYWAAKACGVAVVQTLHNYRFVCANGIILRDGVVCEECVGHLPFAGLRHGCYKGSVFATAPVAAMQVIHRILPTLRTKVDGFISLTESAKQRLSLGGIPSEKMHIKPNFIPGPDRGARKRANRSRQFVFVGSIIEYKGLDLLLDAWTRCHPESCRLIIIGEGPAKPQLQARYPESDGIGWLGRKDHESTMEVIESSDFLVSASRVVEGMPMVVVEAMSAGTPVIAPGHGSFAEMIRDGEEGFLFQPGDVDSLKDQLLRALTIDDKEWSQLSDRAIREYNERYTEQVNHRLLSEIYRQAIESASSAKAGAREG